MNARPAHQAQPGGESRFRSIDDVPDGDWRAGHLFTSRPYLAAIEASLRDRVRFDYAVWRTPSGVEGGALFQSFDLRVASHLPMLAPGFAGTAGLAPALRPLLAGTIERLALRIVVCGNFFVGGPHGTWRSPGCQPANFDRWLAATARQLAAEASARGARALVFLKDYGASRWQAPDASFVPLEGDPVMALDLPAGWRDLGDYADALRASYRREFKRVRRRAEAVERRPLDAGAILLEAARIDALHGEVLARARVLPVRKDAQLFARLAQQLGAHFSLVGYYHRRRLVAFNTRFLCGDELESHYFGVDRGDSEALGLYKNLLLDDVAEALARRCRRVRFGRDAQAVKSGLGAHPVPSTSFLHHPSRLTAAVLAAMARLLGPVSWSPRHPFREAGGTTRA